MCSNCSGDYENPEEEMESGICEVCGEELCEKHGTCQNELCINAEKCPCREVRNAA